MFQILASGHLQLYPVQRQTRTGRPYVTALLTINDAADYPPWSLLAHLTATGIAAKALIELRKGDFVSVAGNAKQVCVGAGKPSAQYRLAIQVERLTCLDVESIREAFPLKEKEQNLCYPQLSNF